MFYVVSKLFIFVFTPSNFIAFLVLGSALLLAFRTWHKAARHMMMIAAALLLICGFSPVGAWLSIPLEQRFQQPAAVGKVSGIILLGGYEDTAVAQARHAITVNESSDRLLEAIRLTHLHPDAKLVLSGAWATLLPNDVDATAPISAYLESIGVPRDRIVSEPRSRNTAENATFAHSILKPGAGDKFILVTSAYHMPRAVGAFRTAGMDVIPWPADYRTRGWSDAAVPFQSVVQGLERMDLASKEWLGLLAYWLTGRTSELFPSP